MKFLIEEKLRETDDVFSFILQPQEPISWQAGQYVLYKILHDNPDNRGDTRIFTISSPPFQRKIRLTTRYLFAESSSFKKALFAKEAGDTVEAIKIDGSFTVNVEDKKLVFVAGGIGITPYHSILLELEKREENKDIILIYSNKDENHIIFKDTIERLAKQYDRLDIVYLFSPQRCDIPLIKKVVLDIAERIFYISGPMVMVKSVEEALHELGVDGKKIKKDYFPGITE
jgi:ferredoxin-NADP reductase